MKVTTIPQPSILRKLEGYKLGCIDDISTVYRTVVSAVYWLDSRTEKQEDMLTDLVPKFSELNPERPLRFLLVVFSSETFTLCPRSIELRIASS